jgi:hypothetical protein
MSSAIHASILHMTQIERREILHDPRHPGVPSGASKMISKLVVRSMQTMQLSCVKISTKRCTYLAPTLTLSPKGKLRDST